MALFRRRRSLWLLLWTMVTFTAIPYKSTTPYTTAGVNGVATPVGVEGRGMKGEESNTGRARMKERQENAVQPPSLKALTQRAPSLSFPLP